MSPYRDVRKETYLGYEEALEEAFSMSEWTLTLLPWYRRLFADEGLVRWCRAYIRFNEEWRNSRSS